MFAIVDIAGTQEKAEKGMKEFCFEKKGELRLQNGARPLSIAKTVSPAGDSALRARYSLTNNSSVDLNFVFGVEFNFSIDTGIR